MNNTTRVLMIDDFYKTSTVLITTSVNTKTQELNIPIEIDVLVPSDFEKTVEKVMDKITGEVCDCIVINLHFDNVDYRGSTLVAELRERIKEEKRDTDVPMILISDKDYVKKQISFGKDRFIMFDDRFLISDILTNGGLEHFTKCLYSYSKAYSVIKDNQDLIVKHNVLLQNFDDEFLADLKNQINNSEKHKNYMIAHFILKEVVQRPGLLIDEQLLAVRLGVDIEKSNESWKLLLKEFEAFKYKGIFSETYDRWWFRDISSFISSNIHFSLHTSGAEERVKKLSQYFEIKGLVFAEPLDKSFFSNFIWTICQKYKKPINMSDAYEIFEETQGFYWQEKYYYSKAALINKELVEGCVVEPNDFIDKLETILANKEMKK